MSNNIESKIIVGELTIRKPFNEQNKTTFEISDKAFYNSTFLTIDEVKQVRDYLDSVLNKIK